MRFATASALAIALVVPFAAAATAQDYPSRTVTVVVPFPAGGSVDGVARILTQKLNETMGQHFIVENRAGGASGIVGANAVAKAAPDGYTLLVSASVHVINPLLYKSVPYDVVRDFTPVTLLAEGPLIVSTTPSVPANNLKDFFALVRKNPQKYTFGATTIGSAGHLAIELLKRDAGLDTLVITYKGTAPALTDLMSGQIQLLVDPMLSSLPLAQGGIDARKCPSNGPFSRSCETGVKNSQGGRLRALAVTGSERSSELPDVPTMAEAGYPEVNIELWSGLFVVAGTSLAITNKLATESRRALADPGVRAKLKAMAVNPGGGSGEEFRKKIDADIGVFADVVKAANLKFEE
jgi:tripartite-type tricarboxylate transporter receptor subunit TctC